MLVFRVLAAHAAFFGLAAGAVSVEAPPRLSLLIVDGMNNHDWPRATKILGQILQGSGQFAVQVSTSPAGDAGQEAWDRWQPEYAKYDVVLSNFNGGRLHWPRRTEKALEDYVAGGGGLVIYHSANNSFPNWTAYNEMIGLGWRDKDFGPGLTVTPDEKVVEIPRGQGRNPGHGPEHDFQMTVLGEHPITRGLPKKWLHPHEQLTHGQHGPAKGMSVLTYAYSKDSGANEPIDWITRYGKGRIYTTMLGHLWKDGPDTAMRCTGFQTMLIRGCQWAATGEATYPVPKDFPTATEIRLAPRPPAFQIATRKPEDRIDVTGDQAAAVFDVASPSGIGGATIARTAERWPDAITLRLHLRGLESFAVSNGKARLAGSMLSHSGHTKRLYIDHVGQADDRKPEPRAPGTEIKVFDAGGKPASGLPGDGGYFEITLPKALLDGQPKSLELGWIDFYR